MKKELKNKLIFISGVVFALALLFVSVQMIRAAQTNTWSAPTQPFPQADVFAPLDTSNVSQAKEASIRFENVTGTALVLGKNNTITTSGGGGASLMVSDPYNFMRILGDGLVLPRLGVGAANSEGALRYNVATKSAQVNNGTEWKDIGSGSGGGESVWTKVTAGAYFNGDATLGTMVDQGGYEPTGKVFTVDSKTLNFLDQKEFAFINKVNAAPDYENNRLLECDKSDVQEECFGFVVVGGYHAIGNLKYDRYMDYEKPGKVFYKELAYKIKPAEINSTGTLYVKDINISQPSWAGGQQEVFHKGGVDTDIPGNNYKSGWTDCPNGYFVSGFRLGHDPDGLTFVLRCSKL